MSDKTVSLNSRHVNVALRTRLQAGNNHLRRQKVDLEAEKKYSSHQLDIQQRLLQDKLRKLRLRQQVTRALMIPKEKSNVEPDASSNKTGDLLQPLEHVINPYPVTFESTGKLHSQRHPEHPTSKSLPRLPDISQRHHSTLLLSPRNPRLEWRRAKDKLARKYIL